MRAAALLLTLVLAGCGSAPQEHAVEQPAVPPQGESKVFTVPDELPARERLPATPKRKPAPRAAEGAPDDAQIREELAAALGLEGTDGIVDQAGLTADGLATVPPSAPAKVAAIIHAANQVAKAPYRYGGGHGGVASPETWIDTAYDCSGSMSFALANAGLLEGPLNSTGFMSWGDPGPGKWVTLFANEGHAFMVVAGLRFDTVERARTGTRWGRQLTDVSGFTVRHPPGL